MSQPATQIGSRMGVDGKGAGRNPRGRRMGCRRRGRGSALPLRQITDKPDNAAPSGPSGRRLEQTRCLGPSRTAAFTCSTCFGRPSSVRRTVSIWRPTSVLTSSPCSRSRWRNRSPPPIQPMRGPRGTYPLPVGLRCQPHAAASGGALPARAATWACPLTRAALSRDIKRDAVSLPSWYLAWSAANSPQRPLASLFQFLLPRLADRTTPHANSRKISQPLRNSARAAGRRA